MKTTQYRPNPSIHPFNAFARPTNSSSTQAAGAGVSVLLSSMNAPGRKQYQIQTPWPVQTISSEPCRLGAVGGREFAVAGLKVFSFTGVVSFETLCLLSTGLNPTMLPASSPGIPRAECIGEFDRRDPLLERCRSSFGCLILSLSALMRPPRMRFR